MFTNYFVTYFFLSRSHTRDLFFFFFFSTRSSLFFRFFAGGSAAAGAEGAGALLFLISSHRCSAADAVRRVPIAAAITSHLDRVWLCSAQRRRSAASSSGVHLGGAAGGEVEGCPEAASAAAFFLLIVFHRDSAADAVRRVPIAAAITSHLDGVFLCSAWRRRSAASSAGVQLLPGTAGGTAAGGAAGGGAGGAADAVTPTAGLHLPPLQWPSVFFGKAAPQPGHVARRL